MTVFPVWMDVFCTLTVTSSTRDFSTNIDYQIKDLDKDEVLFNGKAYKLPNSNDITFNITKIVQSFVKSSLYNPDFVSTTDGGAYLHFGVFVNNSLKEEYITYNDYSYRERDSVVLNEPINGDYDVLGRVSVSVLNTGATMTGRIEGSNGMFHFNAPNGVSHSAIDCIELGAGPFSVIVGGKKAGGGVIRQKCKPYSLFYKNLYGGYDFFSVDGNIIKSDEWSDYEISHPFNNNNPEFERDTFLLEVGRKWELHTDYLTREQIERLDNIYHSTKVYLYDGSKFIPVTIEDSSLQYSYYDNNGHKMQSYTINIKESQTKVIR